MWTPNLAGPFIFDPDVDAPAVDLDAWEITPEHRTRHKPTGCEFRIELTKSGQTETWLKRSYRPRVPPSGELAALAHASVLAGFALRREQSAFWECDAQNRADRVPLWV